MITFSGLSIFLISLKLFGFSGRGTMAYGMSVFSMFGIIFSFNMGRAFLKVAQTHTSSLNKVLNQVLLINVALMILGIAASIFFWLFVDSAKSNISIKTFLIYSLIIPYCMWTINGPAIYASIEKTFFQDLLILLTRVFILLFGFIFIYFEIKSFNLFIFIYSLILSTGVAVEMLILYDFRLVFIKILNKNEFYALFRDCMPGHLDFIAFNIFPVLLILICGISLQKQEIGEVNYVMQMINFIFIFGYVASLKVKSYTAAVGYKNKSSQILKLVIFTTLSSVITILAIDVLINYGALDFFLPDLRHLTSLFLLGGVSIFGYIAYQFSYPIILESGLIKNFSKLNWINLVILVFASLILVPKFGAQGAVALFSLFHMALLVTSICILRGIFKKI